MGLLVDIPTKFLSLLKNLFVDIPKPRAWPPPPLEDTQRVTELLEYGAKRDPVGDRVHTWFACLFLFCLPLHTIAAGISMAILFGYSLLRLPTTWRTLTPLLKSSVYWSILAWVLFSTLSIAWSSDKTMGWDHASSMWRMAVPIPLLLWPVLRRWKRFIIAGLLGVCLQNMFQFSEIVGSWFLDGQDWIWRKTLDRPSGLTKHNGTAAIFIGVAGITWFYCLIIIKNTKLVFYALLLTVFGIVVVQSRAVWLGFSFSLVLLCSSLLLYKYTAIRRTALIMTSVLCVAGVSIWISGPFLFSRIVTIPQSLRVELQGLQPTSIEFRMRWWTETLRVVASESTVSEFIAGRGLGSTATLDYSIEDSNFPATTDQPHNAFIQILFEGGVIGLSLFAFMLWKSMAVSVKRVGESCDIWLPPATFFRMAFICLWATVAFFDGCQNSGRSLALLMVYVAIGVMYMPNRKKTESA